MSNIEHTDNINKPYSELTAEDVIEIKAILEKIRDLGYEIPFEYLQEKEPALEIFLYA
jgi:hypothetical protein